MVLDPIPQTLPVHFFGSRPQPPTSHDIAFLEWKFFDITKMFIFDTTQICDTTKLFWMGVWMHILRNPQSWKGAIERFDLLCFCRHISKKGGENKFRLEGGWVSRMERNWILKKRGGKKKKMGSTRIVWISYYCVFEGTCTCAHITSFPPMSTRHTLSLPPPLPPIR